MCHFSSLLLVLQCVPTGTDLSAFCGVLITLCQRLHHPPLSFLPSLLYFYQCGTSPQLPIHLLSLRYFLQFDWWGRFLCCPTLPYFSLVCRHIASFSFSSLLSSMCLDAPLAFLDGPDVLEVSSSSTAAPALRLLLCVPEPIEIS